METLIANFLENFSSQDAIKLLYLCKSRGYFNIGLTIGKFILKTLQTLEIYEDVAMCAFYTKKYDVSYELFQKLLEFKNISEDKVKNILYNMHYCIPHIEYKFINYNKDIIDRIIHKKENCIPLITFTITTCKRLDLFEQTMNSFLNCCSDILLIDKWLCIDDNSSDSDRQIMKVKYPFFQFYLKSFEEKGHPKSMNIIKHEVLTPYIFHMEDDWIFYEKRNYISECLDVLTSNTKIGQCLINKNYAETYNDINIVGGYYKQTLKGLRYYIHEYCHTEKDKIAFSIKYKNNRNCSYWPYFSFRPSLLRMSVLKHIGEFNNLASHFEMEYSYRYADKEYVSAFLEGIYSKHIGRLTKEKDDDSKLNAYKLNDEIQFTGKQKEKNNIINMKMFIINLERRPDRWLIMQQLSSLEIFNPTRFYAIDGLKLVSTPQLQRIFEHNDYNMRRGMVGCAMSHIKLYTNLIYEQHTNFYCILEDDIELVPDFDKKLIYIMTTCINKDWDIIYLGHHMWKHMQKPEYYNKHDTPVLEKWNTKTSIEMSVGGTTGYIISKRGAKRLLDFINIHSMTNGIDTIQQKSADTLDVYYCKPHLVYSQCCTDNNNTDTDIQKDYSSLSISIQDRVKTEIEYYKEFKPEIIFNYNDLLQLLSETILSKVIIYTDTDPNNIKHIINICNPHLYYTLDDKNIVIVPLDIASKKYRYFQRTIKNNKYDVEDAILYNDIIS